MGFAPIRRTRLNQPSGDGIDWTNQGARGISLELSTSALTNVATGKPFSVTGTKKAIGRPGTGLGFGSTDGAGTTDKLVDSGVLSATARSILVLAKLNGFGGGGFGRFFENSGAGNEMFYVNSSLGLIYWRQFSGGQRTANSTTAASVSDTFGKVTAYSVSFDASNPANQPELYINGTRQAYSSADGIPTGTPNSYTGACIGNRATDSARCCDGTIYVARVIDRVLAAKEHAEFYANPWQVFL